MRNFRVIINILFLHFLITSCNRQSSSVNGNQINIQENKKDGMNLCRSRIKQINMSELSVSGIFNGFSKSEIQSRLGNPDSTSSYDNELSNQVHELYYYGKSYFELMEGKVVSFEILDDKLKLDRFNLTVGNNISDCNSLLELVTKDESLKVRVPIEGEDSAIIFNLDKTKKILSIYQWVNW